MKSKSVRGWLSQAKKASQPIMIAVKMLQRRTGIDTPQEFEKQYMSMEQRSESIRQQKEECERLIEEKKISLKKWLERSRIF